MEVDGEQWPIKLDSGARYSVAGTDWRLRGERLQEAAPVDFVEGIGGFGLDVIGVWSFQMRNVFGQIMEIRACIIDGCTEEFLVGVDFLVKRRASLRSNEVRYVVHSRWVIIPFRTEGGDCAKVASVRLVKKVHLGRSAVTPVEVMVAAPDGEEGIFLPTQSSGAVLLAVRETVTRGGKALVPAINVHGGSVKLPAKKELGTWVPVGKDVEVLAMNGKLKPGKLRSWLKTLGDVEMPLENEEDVHIDSDDEETYSTTLTPGAYFTVPAF
ncbi:hypothetical protein PR003_g23736 [Phytophthora rubi]|uniref:Peptidase A2 domain-containing protein n=1 Tax=Phytophthora rubi TaxID=129364 RepID=A0A6A4D2B6_9STRA|nr:hypothetical protein PR003_g23736 [Phytophthora rubi]